MGTILSPQSSVPNPRSPLSPNLETKSYDNTGVVLLVLCWAVSAWVAFAFGVLIYDNVGEGAEVEFMKSWYEAISTDVFGVESLKVMGRRALFVLIFQNAMVLFGQNEMTAIWHERVLESGVDAMGDVNDSALEDAANDDILDGADEDVDVD